MSLYPIPSNDWTAGHDSGQTCFTAGGMKNLWIRIGCLWNLDFGTFNVRPLASEGSRQVFFEELEVVKWDIKGLIVVRKTGEFIELKNR